MNKWEVNEQEQWSEKVRSRRFFPTLLDKNRNDEGIWSNKIISFVKPWGLMVPHLNNETLFASLSLYIYTYIKFVLIKPYLKEVLKQ